MLKHHWDTDCHLDLTHQVSLPGWSVFSRPNSSSSSISSASIGSEADFPSFCNWIAGVLFGITHYPLANRTVAQMVQSQLPCQAIYSVPSSKATLVQRLIDNQATQQHMLCWARARKEICGTHFHLLPMNYSWVPFPLISPRCVLTIYSFSAIWRLRSLNVQRTTTTPEYNMHNLPQTLGHYI